MQHLTPLLLALSSLTCLANGQFWPGVTATTNMGTFSTYSLPNLTNGVGLSAMNLSATHSATYQQMWMSNANMTSGWIQFDLGSIQPIATIAVWNYNYNSSNTLLRGVATMNVSTSLDGSNFTPLPPQQQLPQGTGQPIPARLIQANGFPARYVKFDVLTNFGTNYTGLSEVQFVVGSCKGSIAKNGTGCKDAGSTTNDFSHTGCADLGTTLSLELNTSVSATGPLFLVLGASDQVWNGVPLPINLGSFNAPGCHNYIAHSLVLNAPPRVNGRSTLPVPIPNAPNLSSAIVFTQFFHLDAAANPFGLVTSDYLKLTLQ